MKTLPPESEVLATLVGWAGAEPSVRAVIMTSSRTRPDGPVDLLSDYDIVLVVTDPERFAREDGWTLAYGTPLVRWGDQAELHGRTTYFRGVVYEDYVKIDYSLWPDSLLGEIAARPALPDCLDVGYRVLLDKNGGTAGWQPPAYRAHIPARPTEAEYQAQVEEFWWGTTYVAKSLWRDELVFARWVLDEDIKNQAFRRLLEWHIEIAHGWSVKPGVFGRGLKRLLPADIWSALAETYVGPDMADNWAALFRTTALFRRVATDVGQALGYAYPQRVDDQVSAELEWVRGLPREAEQ